MNMPVIGKEAVGNLVPHKRSMLLLDGLTAFSRESASATSMTLVSASNLFFDASADGIPGYVCFELMAQTISAYDFLMRSDGDGEPKLGFILGVDDLKLSRALIARGERIDTTIRQDCAIGGAMYSFVGQSNVGDETVAEATLMVYTVDHPEAFMG